MYAWVPGAVITSDTPSTSSAKAAFLTAAGNSVDAESNVISPPFAFVFSSVELSLANCAKSAPDSLALARTSLALSSLSSLIICAVTSGVYSSYAFL